MLDMRLISFLHLFLSPFLCVVLAVVMLRLISFLYLL
jgi:hypothetical protein